MTMIFSTPSIGHTLPDPVSYAPLRGWFGYSFIFISSIRTQIILSVCHSDPECITNHNKMGVGGGVVETSDGANTLVQL